MVVGTTYSDDPLRAGGGRNNNQGYNKNADGRMMMMPGDDTNLDELEFMTSIDDSVRQNVPIPQRYGMTGAMTASSSQEAATGGASSGGYLANSAHPVACIFHCIFKLAALLLYIFGGYFASSRKKSISGANFIVVTVFCIIFLAADFWVVKNITGRLLVGLRWWNKVEGEDGSSTRWIFESSPSPNKNVLDNNIFWWILYGTPLVWSALFFIGLLKLNFGWLMTVSIAIALSGANLYGYWKCSTDQKAKFSAMVARGAEMGAISMIRNNVFGKFASFASNIAGQSQQQQQHQQQGHLPQQHHHEQSYV